MLFLMLLFKQPGRSCAVFRQYIVDFLCLILLSGTVAQSKTCLETYQDHIQKPLTGDYPKSFRRVGHPRATIDRDAGKNASFSCSHINYFDPNPPPVVMKWYKDGRLLHNISRQVEIFGCRKRPPIANTRLKIVNIQVSSVGRYTCRLFLLNPLDTDPSIFEESFFLNVTGSSVAKESPVVTIHPEAPSHFTLNADEQSGSTEVMEAPAEQSFWNTGGMIVLVVVIVAVCSLLLALLLRNSRKVLLQKLCNKADMATADTAKSPGPHVTRVEWKSSGKEEEVAICKDQNGATVQQCSDYVNNEHYRQMFPFIGDDEWTMLQRSQVDRDKVKCEVEFSMPIVLGTGNFGHVYRGELTKEDGTKQLCAVKRLNDGYKPHDLGHFLMEAITLLKTGRHCNVVSLIGSVLLDAVSDVERSDDTLRRPPILLMELASAGNLKNFLHERRFENCRAPKLNGFSKLVSGDEDFLVGKGITYKNLVSFTYQAARGMEHLTNCNVIHRDLAARNVLLTSDRVVKIADFGLSKQIRSLQQEYYRVHSPSMTPAKWTAPEALWENKFSSKSDVWSYGVLVWEIYSMGSPPYPGIYVGQLYRKLASGYRLDKPMLMSDNTYRILKRCWAWNPDRRPDFKDLASYFDSSLASVAQYVDFNKRSDSFSTSASTEVYVKGNSDLGSDSVFDYSSSAYSAGDRLSTAKDSACFTDTSAESVPTIVHASAEIGNFAFSELINPLYEGEELQDEVD